MSKNQYLIVSLACFTLFAGCGKGGPNFKKVQVSGVVTLDDKPVEGAEVNFFSEENNFLSTGVTDKDGKYQLYQGAAVGDNKVWISKDTSKDDSSPAGGGDPAENPEADISQIEAATGGDPNAEAKGETLPVKFSDPEKSVLTYAVPESDVEDANFKLTGE